MSRKWTNLFRKKGNKADSHGTTAADEELQFQPVPQQSKEPVRLSAMQSNSQPFPMHQQSDVSAIGLPLDEKKKERFPRQSRRGQREGDRNVLSHNKENHGENWASNKFSTLSMEDNTIVKETSSGRNLDSDHQARISKQGGIFEQPRDYGQGKDVSICDEYSDPFDALKQRVLDREKQGTDGYTEPYKAQKMHYEITGQGSSKHGGHLDDSFNENYHDPWDKNENVDYEDPWDSNKQATLPYPPKKSSDGNLHFDPEKFHIHRKLHNGKPHNDSLSSVASSGSSASPSTAARRLVRVEHPRTSPKSSPHFDRRLILAKEPAYNNYSEPWGNQGKFRPTDKRLIKAEPSLEELRRMSPGGRSSPGTGSTLSSGRDSPDLTHSQFARMSPSAHLNHSQSGLPPHIIHQNRSKSRSLDMRNNPGAFAAVLSRSGPCFPKSASDDQLTTASSCHYITPSASGNQLNGLCEYEEPWDKSDVDKSNSYSNANHTRSRSYDVQGSPMTRQQIHSNTMKPGTRMRDDSFYEHPWDKNPADHLQSMQRFQQRKLELHPTEAINSRDFDPLQPLENQTWYHGAITRDEAESKLREKYHGSFLVRKSESAKDSYSLSVQSSIGCIHMLLRCTRDDSWILGEFSAPFLSAPEMVAYYTRNRLKISDSDYVLLSYPVADTIV